MAGFYSPEAPPEDSAGRSAASVLFLGVVIVVGWADEVDARAGTFLETRSPGRIPKRMRRFLENPPRLAYASGAGSAEATANDSPISTTTSARAVA